MPGSDLEKRNTVLALLDVDQTLITGSYTIDLDVDNNEEIRRKVQGALNPDLMKALKAADIKDIYLFTDMTLNKIGILERRALVDVLKGEGFHVHGIITPADCAWHLPGDQLKAFMESKEALLLKWIDNESKEVDPGWKKEMLDKIQENVNYQALISSEIKGSNKPGKAFEDTEKEMDSAEVFNTSTEKSINVKSFTKLQSVLEEMSHLKGKMFQCLLNNLNQLHSHKFKRIVVCDDCHDVLKSIKQANDVHPHSIDTATVYINNNTKRKSKGEQTKDFGSYLNEIKASEVLKKACATYRHHLESIIAEKNTKNGKKNNQGVSKHKKNKNFALAQEKLAVVIEMQNTLGKTVGDIELKAFHKKFIENRAILEIRRDSWGGWFLKVVATVFSFGIAAAFGIWSVKGKEMVREIEPFLPVMPKP